MTAQPPHHPRALRASDADRERVLTIVQEAHADGRLDLSELDERIGAVYASKTLADLDAVTADLVPRGPAAPQGRTVLKAKGSNLTRSGAWTVPAHLVVEAAHSRVDLDFTEVVVPPVELVVELNVKHSGVHLVVPRGWGANADELANVWGKVHARLDQPVAGHPHLTVVGRSKHSSITIAHPARRWWQR